MNAKLKDLLPTIAVLSVMGAIAVVVLIAAIPGSDASVFRPGQQAVVAKPGGGYLWDSPREPRLPEGTRVTIGNDPGKEGNYRKVRVVVESGPHAGESGSITRSDLRPL